MILIGTDEGIYRWFEGAGWPVFHSLQDRSVVGLASPGSGVIVALDRAGDVLETTDNGQTWRAIPRPEGSGRPSVLAVEGSPPSVLMGVKPLGVYRRPIGAPVPKAPPAPPPAGAGLRPRLAHSGRVLAERTTAILAPGRPRVVPDAEEVRRAGWTEVAAPPAPRATVEREIRAVAEAPGVWFAAVSGAGLWASRDLGASWSQCPGLPAEVYAVRPVARRPGHVWIATDDGCWLSTDSGASWADRSAGLGDDRHARAIEVRPDEPDVLLAGAAPRAGFATPGGAAPREGLNFALYESADGGKTWTHVLKGFPDRIEYDTITDVRHDPAAPDNIVVALGSGELWVSRNAGAYWGPLARQIKAARVLCGMA